MGTLFLLRIFCLFCCYVTVFKDYFLLRHLFKYDSNSVSKFIIIFILSADKQRRKNAEGDKFLVLFAAVLRIAANYCFHGYNFFESCHEYVGIKWRDFTEENRSELTSLLAFLLFSAIHFL